MGENRTAFALRVILLAALFVSVIGSQACLAYNPGDPEFRGIFVTAWHVGLKSQAEIDQLVSTAQYCNANTIVAQVRRRGDTIYPSVEPTASGFSSGFDPLAYLIQKCHNASPRIEVQAWFVVWPIAGNPPTTNENHPYHKYPQWLTKTSTGATLIADDYWFDPGHPQAAQYTYNLIMDLVNRYDVDGINLDYIRFGSNDAGYNDVSVARFNSFSSRYGGDFNRWRRDQVTNFVRKVYANAIAVKPNLKVTADVIAGTPAPTDLADFRSRSQAYTKYFQDFPSWMQEGILDMDIGMTYFDCYGEYGPCYDPWVCFLRNHAYNRQAVAAPGVYSASCLTTQLDHTRTLACGPVTGGAIYAYHTMDASTKNAARSVWSTSAPIPAMPWKSSPTRGHIKGNVTFGGTTWIDGATINLAGPVNRTMYSDGTGFYAFIDVPPGNYTVTCTATGYGVLQQGVQVTAGQVATANINYPVSTLTISNIQVSETASGATITWTTNAGSSSKVYYGLDRTCSSSTPENPALVNEHTVALSGLQSNTVYYFRVYSLNPDAPAAMSEICVLVTKPSTPADIIIDNPSASLAGGWQALTSSTDKYGSDYLAAYGNEGTDTATYRPNLPMAGTYRVYEWHTQGGNRCNSVPHTVTYNGGSRVYYVNQQVGGGAWNLLGTHSFAAGTSGSLAINNAATGGSVVIADAVKFSWVNTDTAPPSVPASLTVTDTKDDSITLGWTASTDDVGVAGYRVSRGLTSAVTAMDVAPTNSYVDTNVLPNTHYWYAVSAYDTSGNKSATTSTVNVWTLSPKPTSANITCDKQAGIWHPAGPFTFTAVGGFGPGTVGYYRYVFDTSPTHTWTGTESTWVVGTKACPATTSALPYYLHIKGYNQANVPGEASDLGPFYIDETPPETPVVDDGKYTASTNMVNASWSASDPESGISEYEYAVGTSPLGTQIRDWTSVGPSTSAAITGLSLSAATTYYVSVRATNHAGLVSSPASSTGVKVAQPVPDILAAKAVDDGTAIALAPQVVSAVFPTAFYLEDPDRFTAIRVQAASELEPDDLVSVMGTMGLTNDGERAILDPVFPDPTETGNPIMPVVMLAKTAGGGTQGKTPGTTGGVGLNTTGLLVKIAGKVSLVVSDGFYLDDGSGLNDGVGSGIKVWTGAPDSAIKDTWITVTGVISLRKPASIVYPQLLRRP